jgi:ABC-2 type transport system permease protein
MSSDRWWQKWRKPTTVVAWLVGRRAVRSGVGWGAVFGVYVTSSAAGYASQFPTDASRLKFARSLGSNVGLQALLGPARRIDTVAGFTAWRALGVLSLVGAVWGLLAGTRLLRGEEEAGRWELLLAGQTTRRRAAAQGLAGLATGWVALLATTALITIAGGRTVHPPFSLSGALFFAVALTASAAVFLAVGAVASQLAATRRQAASLTAGVLGVAFVIRMVADSGSHLRWALWLSPLGWVEEMHPFTGPRPALLVPVAALTISLGVLAIPLAGSRDLGSSILPARDTAPARTRLLGSPAGLAVRLSRPVTIGWITAIAACGLLFGLVAQSAADAVSGSATVEDAIRRLGGRHGGADAYLGLTFLVIATLVALVAAGQVAANREEEASGRLENLLTRAVGRPRWLAGRLAMAAVLIVACGAAAGVLAWAGAASQNSGVKFGALVAAGINTVPPAAFLLGLGTLVYGALPRAAVAATYGLIAWSFLIEFVGSVVKASSLLLDTSVLYHVAPAPATNPHWSSAAALTGLGIAAAVAGGALFTRRDVVGG